LGSWKVYQLEGPQAFRETSHPLSIESAKSALRETEKIWGPAHVKTMVAKFDVASARFRNGDYAGAVALAEEVLHICERHYGAIHTETEKVLDFTQLVCNFGREYARAEYIGKRLIALQEIIYGANHPRRAVSIMNLAQTYYAQERFADAEPLIVSALEILNETEMANNRSLVPVFQNIADFFADIGKPAESQKWEEHALQILTNSSKGINLFPTSQKKRTAITKKKRKKRRYRQRRRSLLEQGFRPYLGTLRIRELTREVVIPHSDVVPRFDIFGDESTAPGIVVYGLIALSATDADNAKKEFTSVISNAGLPEHTRAHAKDIFHGDRRALTPWSKLSHESTLEVIGKIFELLVKNQAIFSIGIVDQSTYPEKIPSGFGDTVMVTASELYPLAFWASAAPLSIGAIGKQKLDLKWYLDEQVTRARMWGAGRCQVQRMFTFAGIELEPLGNPKPLLLDAADLFAYVAGRAISPRRGAYTELFQDWYQLCAPMRAHFWWIPQAQERPPSFLRELKDSSRIEL